MKPSACWEFQGEILVLHHPTTISPKYQAMGKSHWSLSCPPPPPQTIQFVTILNKIIKKSENLTLDHRCSPLSFSALWQHSADGDHFIHGQRTSQNRRQSVGALRVHKTTGVPETRYADGFPRRSNESRRHHRQHVAPSNEQTGSEIKTEDPPQQTPF